MFKLCILQCQSNSMNEVNIVIDLAWVNNIYLPLNTWLVVFEVFGVNYLTSALSRFGNVTGVVSVSQVTSTQKPTTIEMWGHMSRTDTDSTFMPGGPLGLPDYPASTSSTL